MTEHVLYETGDKDAPDAVKDRNGEVVLGLCKVCGLAEIQLDETPDCPGSHAMSWVEVQSCVATMRSVAAIVGPLHGLWDVIFDAEALLQGRATIVSPEKLVQIMKAWLVEQNKAGNIA